MGIGPLLAVLFITATVVSAEPLKKEVFSLPPLIHFSDVFNTHSDKEHEQLTELTGTRPTQQTWPSIPASNQPPRPGQGIPPICPLPGGYPPGGYPPGGYPPGGYPPGGYPPGGYPPGGYPPGGYPPGGYPPGGYPPGGYPPGGYPPGGYPPGGYPPGGYPPGGYPPGGYPPGGYPPGGYPQGGYPPGGYPPQQPKPPYLPGSYQPRQEDVELVERYSKFNDDGSKEYKLVLSNGLTIYQKILAKNGDKQNVQMLEGYYSDRRDDNTYLTTYFRADEKGYNATSEISASPPSFPDVAQMTHVPILASNRKSKK